MQPTLAVVSCVNARAIMDSCLCGSPDIASGAIPLIPLWGERSASQAYARVMDEPPAQAVIFAHQDIYFPAGWFDWLAEAMGAIARVDPDWAVIGAFGADAEGKAVGHIYDRCMQGVIGQPFGAPRKVSVLDEIVIVVRSGAGVNFDPALPGFHMYGTDIALTAARAGRGVYVANLPLVHNSRSIDTLDRHFRAAWSFVDGKWRDARPIPSLICGRVEGVWPLLRWRIRNRVNLITKRRVLVDRVADPAPLVAHLNLR
jgi:hypothetical protein